MVGDIADNARSESLSTCLSDKSGFDSRHQVGQSKVTARSRVETTHGLNRSATDTSARELQVYELPPTSLVLFLALMKNGFRQLFGFPLYLI